MRVYYLTVLEGYQEANRGLFHSQVVRMIGAYNRLLDHPIELISVIEARHREESYVHELSKKAGVQAYVLAVSSNMATIRPSGAFLRSLAALLKPDEDGVTIVAREVLAASVALRTTPLLARSRCFVILDKRGLPAEESLYQASRSLPYRVGRYMAFKAAERYSIGRVHGMRCVTRTLYEFLVERYQLDGSVPITITPTGIDPQVLPVGVRHRRSGAPVVVYAGGSADYQQIPDVLDFFGQCHTVRPNGVRTILCSYFTAQEAAALKRRFPCVEIRAGLSHDEILEILGTAHFGVCFRGESVINAVSSPTKISEYASLGLGVVFSGRIGVLEDMKRARLGVTAMHREEFLERLRSGADLHPDPEGAPLSFFSFEHHARQLQGLLNKVWGR